MVVARLVDRDPTIDADELVSSLAPPPRFADVRFDNYIPNPDEPSQAQAVEWGRRFVDAINNPPKRGLFGKRKSTAKQGLYLDGGFGVGKTHLLSSIWHESASPRAYGTFVELTNLVGALGFRTAVQRLSEHRLLAIDEFELDDPGDTMLVTKLIAELTDAGVHVAATSNTLPDKLGEGRFAAVDFLREIHAMSERFDVVRVDGPDYRHRGLPDAPAPLTDVELQTRVAAVPGATMDSFDELCEHLARLHPSRYGALTEGVPLIGLRGVRQLPGQDVALRMVAFADRIYDRAIPVAVSGNAISDMFTEEMLRGGYRKKYLRAISRLVALSRD